MEFSNLITQMKDYIPIVQSNVYVKIVAAEKSIHPPPRTEVTNMVTKLKENKKVYTQRQFDQSKRSR